jgi:hypothetical protein
VGVIDLRGEVSCEDYACDENKQIKTPKISLDIYKNNDYPNLKKCEQDDDSDFSVAFIGGFFQPLFNDAKKGIKDEFLVPFNVQACFNIETDFWNFKINNGDEFAFRVVEDLCPNLTTDEKLIRDELDLLDRIPDSDVCQALKDFEESRRYYGEGGNIYKIKGAYAAHEKVHELRFKTFIKKVLTSYKYKGYSKEIIFSRAFTFEKSCGEFYLSKSIAEENAKKRYNDIMDNFIKTLKNYREVFLSKGIHLKINGIQEKYSINEILTQWHWRVQSIINIYQNNLKNFRNKELWANCDYERKKKVFEQQIYERLIEKYDNSF